MGPGVCRVWFSLDAEEAKRAWLAGEAPVAISPHLAGINKKAEQMDLYRNFKTLAAHEVENTDFRIWVRDLKSPVSIVAPHGGRIEPGTCLIAQKIAGTLYNYYCFEGLKDKKNKALHITSHRFDEPRALDLITASDIVVTIHACKDRTNTVYIGGLYRDLALEIDKYLTKIKFHVARQENYAGIHPDNICNKAKIKKGVQLEISRSIRDDPEKTEALSTAMQNCLNRFTSTLIIDYRGKVR